MTCLVKSRSDKQFKWQNQKKSSSPSIPASAGWYSENAKLTDSKDMLRLCMFLTIYDVRFHISCENATAGRCVWLSSLLRTLGAFSYLALSHGLAFFHAGCRNRWALKLASHSLMGTGRKYDYLQMHLYLCPTYCSLAAGWEGLLTRLFIEKIMSSVDYKPVSFLQIVTDWKNRLCNERTSLTRSSIQDWQLHLQLALCP